jgi:hypothetical protein
MRRFVENLNCRPPATEEAIAAFEKTSGKQLCADYREFLKVVNGGEGFIRKNAYVILWGVDELASMNKAYEVEDYAPGLLIFGSDGGGEAYGFDTRSPQWAIVEMPFVGMAWSLAEPIAASFRGFLEHLYRTEKMPEGIGQQTLDLMNARGKEVFEIQPVILGGSPTDPANKVLLNREEHIRAVVFWNRVIKELREKQSR